MVVALGGRVEESGAAMPLFNIKCNNGTTVSVEAELTCKVLDFKELISPKLDVPAAQQRLIYSGKVLKDTETLESYNLKQGRTVYMAPDEPDARGRDEPSGRRGGASRVGSLITGSGAEPQKKILPIQRF